jgi:transposase-like protein/IS1 family transposase
MLRLIVPVLLLACVLGLVWRWSHNHAAADGDTPTARSRRLLKPRAPADCPACRQQEALPTCATRPPPAVRPWAELKSRRGRRKRILTEGFCCPEPSCPYYRITDAQVHALVGDGCHGTCERIQTFRCQACATTFSARRDTPLYRLKTPAGRVGEVLTALAEGLDVAAATRVFGYDHATITRWLTRAGAHSARLHERWLRHLRLPHVQLDELRTRVRRQAQALWLWVAIDPCTKLMPVVHLGPRSQDAAHAVIHALSHTLAPGCLPVFTSDGLNLYFYALTAHFGAWMAERGRRRPQWRVAPGLLYGQVKKVYRQRRLVRVTPLMRCGTHAARRVALQALGLSGRLTTAFVERVNLTLRRSVPALARRTWATAQTSAHLLAQVQWWRAYYHFCRPHAALRITVAPSGRPRARGSRRYQRQTPAMAAGLTRRCWRVTDVLRLPLPAEPLRTT